MDGRRCRCTYALQPYQDENLHNQRRSFISADPGSMPSLPSWLKESSALSLSNSGTDQPERDARWISDYCDNLSVAIALRQWEEATSLVETGMS